jgi:glycosyltransferase involved in cell wall biosynthesis
MKTALLYDRVNKWGGAERDLLALHELFPDAPLYTAVYEPKKASWAKVFPKVIPSFLQKIPFASDNHEFLGALTPVAFETFDFGGYDLVISVSSEAAKGIIVRPQSLHICYCLTPTRYLWVDHDFYFKNPGKLGKIPFFWQISRPLVAYTKYWDKIAAQRPDIMVAQSEAVRGRIKKIYGRDSQVIYPPVDVTFFGQAPEKKRQNFFLIVSRLVPYKRLELAIETFNILGFPLYIVGSGSEEGRLKAIAKGNVHFLGRLTDAKLSDYYRRCAAFIMPQEEDFGIAAVEAQASGAPVIAYRAGGALDIVEEGKSGLFFERQVTKDLVDAVNKFLRIKFDHKLISLSAKRFSKARFKKDFLSLIKESGRL